MDRYAKLSPTQVRVLRNVRTHTVNGLTTYRVVPERGDKQATFLRLYRLGLLAAPHEYSDLTSLGMDAMNQLNDRPEADRVLVGQAGGKRWEEQVPKSPAVAVAPAEDEPVARYCAVANGFDFAVEDRTDGTFVATGISSLYAARDLAERRNADADPITAADLAEDAPLMTQQIPTLKVLPTPAEMAAAGRFIPLTGGADPASQALMNRIRGLAFQDELRKLWTDDTRVRHQDGRTGNVIAGDTGWVQSPDHVNYGRAYTGVMWDRTPETHVEATWRGRPFTDQLTRI